jgi:hypothetical protein
MSRKATRRKHRPLFDPLAAMRPIDPAKVRADMDRNFLALDAMGTQVGATREQWAELSDCVNTVEMLIEMDEIDGDHMATSQGAIEAMVACMKRHVDQDQPMRMEPSEVDNMRTLLGLYHVCLERKPWMVIYRAQKACTERINKQMGTAHQKAHA